MPYEGESDRELVARFIAGDSAAFDALHGRYYAKIYRLAYLQTNNGDDAEDIAAQTFERALQHLHRLDFSGGDSIYPWLYRVAVNLSVDLCRDKSSRQTVSLAAEALQGVRTFLDRIEDTKPSPEELLERSEVQMLVRSAIASLSDDQRDVITHRFLGELSLKETAEAMHRSESAIKSLLHRGFVSLRKEILKRVSEDERIQLLGREQESTDVRGDSIRIHRRTDEAQ